MTGSETGGLITYPTPRMGSGIQVVILFLRGRRMHLFKWLKKLFSKPEPAAELQAAQNADRNVGRVMEKPCLSCGKPISYDPAWKHIPNYCAACKAKYREKRGMITRTCKRCGKTFTLPENVQHWPNYCQECRARYRPEEKITRKCRSCGRKFTFSSKIQHWPNYCRECQAKRREKR